MCSSLVALNVVVYVVDSQRCSGCSGFFEIMCPFNRVLRQCPPAILIHLKTAGTFEEVDSLATFAKSELIAQFALHTARPRTPWQPTSQGVSGAVNVGIKSARSFF